jgi:hypothetical protein
MLHSVFFTYNKTLIRKKNHRNYNNHGFENKMKDFILHDFAFFFLNFYQVLEPTPTMPSSDLKNGSGVDGRASETLLKPPGQKAAPKPVQPQDTTGYNPPDGGWGWVVCLTSMATNGTVFGSINTFGILYVEMLKQYGDGDKNIGFKACKFLLLLSFCFGFLRLKVFFGRESGWHLAFKLIDTLRSLNLSEENLFMYLLTKQNYFHLFGKKVLSSWKTCNSETEYVSCMSPYISVNKNECMH